MAWIKATKDKDAYEVTDFRDYTRQGGCETCEPEIVVIEVSYMTPNSTWIWGHSVSYEGSFAEFIKMLDQYDI